MTKELKAQLFDEIVENMDNDDFVKLDKGSIWYKAGYRTYDMDDDTDSFETFEEALKHLGYTW